LRKGNGREGCAGGLVVTTAAIHAVSPLALAWRHTEAFWGQTAVTFVRHPLAILACAAVPAAERCYVLLRGKDLNRGKMAALELLATVCRVLLCAVAVWAACSGREQQALAAHMGTMATWQIYLENVGIYVAHHLRTVLWEFLFLVLAVLLAGRIVRWLVAALAHGAGWMKEPAHRQAALSVWRNLIVFPFVLIYLVEMARPTLR
jgi:hypothetical protein